MRNQGSWQVVPQPVLITYALKQPGLCTCCSCVTLCRPAQESGGNKQQRLEVTHQTLLKSLLSEELIHVVPHSLSWQLLRLVV